MKEKIMLNFRYQKSKSTSKDQNKKIRRKLKNENLDLMLKSSNILLEDYIELECQVCTF